VKILHKPYYLGLILWFARAMQSVMSLSIGLLLVSSLATMARVSNPAFAGTGFLRIKKNVWNMLLRIVMLLEIMLFKVPK
jgi:hypothetical protein